MFDLVIRNGLIADGSGQQLFSGDIAIKDERIAEISLHDHGGMIPPDTARRTIDARGHLVTPGFVDVHGHSDLNILACPLAESKLRQGITTEIFGNCGESAFPLYGPYKQSTEKELERLELPTTWRTCQQYFECLEGFAPAINVATYVGHGSVRAAVVGYENRAPSPEETRQMKREIEMAMAQGAIGLSTGLIYPPGMFASTEELCELQAVAQPFGGIYSSHVRSEGDLLLQAADEFLTVVTTTGSQGQFSHLKASGPRNWGKVSHVISEIEDTLARGHNIWWDKYPYVASSTSLASLLPAWVLDGGAEAACERLSNSALRDQIIEEAEAANEGCQGWESVLIVDAACDEFADLQGLSLSDAAERRGMSPQELFIKLLVTSNLRAAICNFTMNWEETDLALTHDRGMVCTDGACRAPYGVLSHDSPHPRTYGTFGAFFRRYVKELQILKLEEAVRKATSLPCEVFGIKQRGRIQKGYFADLLIIDWHKFRDCSEFSNPHQYCRGLKAVIVNGAVTLLDGAPTGVRRGRVLRRSGDVIA